MKENRLKYVPEPARQTPVIAEADVCVVGGSATGVFAAVRAARLGASVVIVERMNGFGGVATNGLVGLWHSLYDEGRQKQIIAGLSAEVLERISPMDQCAGQRDSHLFNPTELKIELDALLKEVGVRMLLHTWYAGLHCDGPRLDAVFVENKDGRGAIRARFFIDATGDGDLCRDLGLNSYRNENVQPPSAVYFMQGAGDPEFWNRIGAESAKKTVQCMIRLHGAEFGLEPDWGWEEPVPGLKNVLLCADTHVFGLDLSRADDLTEAEIVGREKMRKVIRMMRKYGDPKETYALAAACSVIGVRDTRHYETSYRADHMEMLLGKRYADNILNGTYPVDMHRADSGITFMKFDGSCITNFADGTREITDWRKEKKIPSGTPVPTYYSLPFRVLVQPRFDNFLAAGRMIHATPEAFGALRVMINLNQIGEAAGVAAYLSLLRGIPVRALDGAEVARLLAQGGSANLV